MIRVSQIRKSFGNIVALDDVSFGADAGETVGFVGPNGAGKTTALMILSGLLLPDSGEVIVSGHDMITDRHKAQKRMAFLPDAPGLYPEMRVRSYLRFRSKLKGIPSAQTEERVKSLAKATQIGNFLDRFIGDLSKGMAQRVAIADALLADPEVLLFDEPTNGLDPRQKEDFRHLLQSLAAEKTILFSTHALSEVQALCSRAVIIHQGRIVADLDPKQKDFEMAFLKATTPAEENENASTRNAPNERVRLR